MNSGCLDFASNAREGVGCKGWDGITYSLANALLDPATFLILALLHLHVPTTAQDALCLFAD